MSLDPDPISELLSEARQQKRYSEAGIAVMAALGPISLQERLRLLDRLTRAYTLLLSKQQEEADKDLAAKLGLSPPKDWAR